jgi:hypothetical protein
MYIPLCTVLFDGRKEKATAALFCPVADEDQLKGFVTTVKKLEDYKKVDYLFLYRKGFMVNHKSRLFNGLSAIHAVENLPLGSSGAFFVGTYALFREGYEVILIADTDAIPSSKRMLPVLLQKALKLHKVIVPFNIPKESTAPAKNYVINQWGAFPRSVFEKAGFYTPYMWRGGEDYDFMTRLNKSGLLLQLTNVFIYHPRAGYTIFHKMVEKKKFYPYVAGLMKVFLFHSERDLFAALKFFAWFMFYAFFGDAFSDRDIFMMLSKCNQFTTEYNFTEPISKVEIKRIKNRAAFQSSFFDKILKEPKLLFSLLFFKEARVYTDEIRLKMSRVELFAGMLKALFLAPFRFAQAVLAFIKWKKERKKVVYPINVKNAKEAIEIYKKLIIEKKL